MDFSIFSKSLDRTKYEENLNLGVGGFDAPASVPPPSFLPLKLRGNAPDLG